MNDEVIGASVVGENSISVYRPIAWNYVLAPREPKGPASWSVCATPPCLSEAIGYWIEHIPLLITRKGDCFLKPSGNETVSYLYFLKCTVLAISSFPQN